MYFGGLTVFKGGSCRETNERETKMFAHLFAEITGNLNIALTAVAVAVSIGAIGLKASDAVGRNPGAATKVLVQSILAIAFTEAIVFYVIFLVR
jgi:F-type H+-transporting ATPase subunit c